MEAGQLLNSYMVVKQIAIGGYGVVNEGVGPGGESVAIKQELAREKVTRPVLEHEYHVYKILAGHKSIPNVRAYGRHHKFNVMVMDLLGPSLEHCFEDCAKRFCLRTTARLGLGMLDALEYVHSRGFIHRDVKPGNFLLGRGRNSGVVHIIDFGLARPWKHASIGQNVSTTTIEGVLGTLCFASITAHLGKEQTRRDDLQSLAYTILFFSRGSLPWDQIRGPTEKHCELRILEKKRSWSPERLCQHLPHELEEFIGYCYGLKRDDEPDYSLLRQKLTIIANREECNLQANFEWEEPDWKASGTPPDPLVKQVPPPLIKRGDVVLLRLIPEKSLDFENPPRALDTSFFPHETPRDVQQPPYRPAVVRKVITNANDNLYFSLEVFVLMRRDGLDGLSKRRRRCFEQLETLTETVSGGIVPSGDIFVYDHTLIGSFKIEYDQAAVIASSLCIPETTLARLERKLRKVRVDARRQYHSDDEETRHMLQRVPSNWEQLAYVMEMRPCEPVDLTGNMVDFSSITGWNLEMTEVYEVRNVEERWRDDLEDEYLDLELNYFDYPRSAQRRLSCTMPMLASGQADGNMAQSDPFQSNAATGL